jgi:signal peptidase I
MAALKLRTMQVRPLLATVAALGVVLTAATVALAAARGGSVGDPTPEQLRAVFARLHISPTTGDRAYKVPSSSMEPTLHCARPGVDCLATASDRIIARPYGTSRPHRGDIIALLTPPLASVRCGTAPNATFIKRVIALPGERFEERDGYVYIDGKRLAETYVTAGRRDARTIGPATIPPGKYFIMGDARSSSCDSRAWGTLPARNVIGHALAIYWPATRARRL